MNRFLTLIFTPLLICLSFLIGVIALTSIYRCTHNEMGTVFSFQHENSTATSYIKPYCKDCTHHFGYTSFRGNPDDLSYLDVVEQYIDGQIIESGKYYTMTAIVTLGDYEVNKTRVICEVEADNIRVAFSVEFKDEFEEQVSLIQVGDEITFYGRLYDDGFGWTDCELIET